MPAPALFSRKRFSAFHSTAEDIALLAKESERWENEGGHLGPFLRVNLPIKGNGLPLKKRESPAIKASTCNLYRLASSVTEVAHAFHVATEAESNAGERVYPGAPGLVIANGKVRSMTWGMPIAATDEDGTRLLMAVNNVSKKQLDSALWRESFAKRRCLIPLDAFAITNVLHGQIIQKWIAIADRPMFACAGVWRDSDEWGPVYAMVMTSISDRSGALRDGMPVVLETADFDIWLNGSAQDAEKLCIPFENELTVTFTSEPWLS